MAKRFIDTGLFDDKWFSDLTKDQKLLWIYLFTKCNHAGIIEYNQKLWEFQTELKGLDTLMEGLGNRLVTVRNGEYYFIPKFLKYQYPKFPNSKVKSQASALKLLDEFGVKIEKYLTVNKPLPKGYGNDNEYESEFEYGSGIIDNRKFSEICISDQQWLEVVAMQNKKIVEWVGKQLNIFNEHLITSGEQKINLKEYKQHFRNWFPRHCMKLKSEASQNNVY